MAVKGKYLKELYAGMSDEERQAFGEVYLNYVASRNNNKPQLLAGEDAPTNTPAGNTVPLEGVYESQPDDDIPF